MWLLTKIGFFSIVQKPWDKEKGLLTVRSRVKADLESFVELLSHSKRPEIVEDTNADYQFRIQAPRVLVQGAILHLAMDIDYDNFKNAVAENQGYARARLYGRVWAVLCELQSRAKTSVAGLTRQIKERQ